MKLIIIVVIVWVVSQTIKFLWRILGGEKITLSHTKWVYAWGAGSPSTHAAMLTTMLYVIGKYDNYSYIFGISFVAALLFIYNLLAEHRKEELFEDYVRSSKDETLISIVKEGRILDISGHSKMEVVFGIILGLVMGAIFTSGWFFN